MTLPAILLVIAWLACPMQAAETAVAPEIEPNDLAVAVTAST